MGRNGHGPNWLWVDRNDMESTSVSYKQEMVVLRDLCPLLCQLGIRYGQ